MNRDEYLEMLAAEPATPNQRGAIMREFARLGVLDRAERLAVCAELLELDELGSITELVMGQAGRLVKLLERIRVRAELPDVVAAPADDDDPGRGCEYGDHEDEHRDHGDQDGSERVSRVEAVLRIMAMIYAAWVKSTPARCADATVDDDRAPAGDGSPEA